MGGGREEEALITVGWHGFTATTQQRSLENRRQDQSLSLGWQLWLEPCGTGGVGLVQHLSHVILQFLAAHFQLQDEQNTRVNALQ